MGKTIGVQCGIYNTEYTLTRHRDGTGTVRAPYIKWVGGTGSLAFANYHVPSKYMRAVCGFFDRDNTCTDTGDTLDSYLPGYLN